MSFQFAQCLVPCIIDGAEFANKGHIIKVFTDGAASYEISETKRLNAWNASKNIDGHVYLHQIKFLSPLPRKSLTIEQERLAIQTLGLGITFKNSASSNVTPSLPSSNSTTRPLSPPLSTTCDQNDSSPLNTESYKISTYARLNVQYDEQSVVINIPCTEYSSGEIYITKCINEKLRQKIKKKFGINDLNNFYLVMKGDPTMENWVNLFGQAQSLNFKGTSAEMIPFKLIFRE